MMIKKLNVLGTLGFLLATLLYSALSNAASQSVSQRDKNGIILAVTAHIRKSNKNIKFSVTNFDVQGSWAMAVVVAKDKDVDSADVLLKKQKSHWRVLMLGTGAASGDGKKYGLPKHLQKRWGL